MNQPDVAEASTTSVVRDPNFVRLSMDVSYFNFLGHDVEAALMVQSTDIDSIDPSEGIAATSRLSEVARVRMSPASALAMVQNVSMILLHHGLATSPQIIAHVETAAELVRANQTDTGEGEA